MQIYDFLIIGSLVAVVLALAGGLYSLYRGGDFARKYSNRFMRWRVAMQALAIILMVAGLAWKSSAGG